MTHGEVAGRRVLEVGARNVNGSVRPIIEALHPQSYLGIDIEMGDGVDEICDVMALTDRFGEDAFDLVVSTELVEHVRDWRRAFNNMKRVLRADGVIVVTTRSPGFKIHGYPFDYWRYEREDMRRIFADFTILALDDDRVAPGVFVKASKPADWRPADLSNVCLHSVATRRRTDDLQRSREIVFRAGYWAHVYYRRMLSESIRGRVKRAVGWLRFR